MHMTTGINFTSILYLNIINEKQTKMLQTCTTRQRLAVDKIKEREIENGLLGEGVTFSTVG